MAEYRLIGFAESGNAYKCALMLALAGLDWEPETIDYFEGAHREAAFRGLNEMAEVPVLIHEGRHLSQSGAILTYLAERSGRFGPENDEERYEILRWLLFDNHKLTSYTASLRYLLTFAKTGEAEVVAFLRGRTEGALGVLERRLGRLPFVIGERPTIADLSLAGYLFWPEQAGLDWRDYPAIGAWLGRLKALPGWAPPEELLPPAGPSVH